MSQRVESIAQCIVDLRSVLEQLDALGESRAAIHVQWAVDLLSGYGPASEADPDD